MVPAPREIASTAAVKSKLSPWSVQDTVARLCAIARARGQKILAIIDHSAEAETAGVRLRETTAVVLGCPEAWTSVPTKHQLE